MRVIKYRTKLTSDKKVKLFKEMSVNCPGQNKVLNNPEKVYILARDFLRLQEEAEEYVYMVCLDSQNTLICLFEISHGTNNSSIVGVREIFQKALLSNANSIAIIHNHPSGNCGPSDADKALTKKIKDAGSMIGVPMVDHIIVGDGVYYSFGEADEQW